MTRDPSVEAVLRRAAVLNRRIKAPGIPHEILHCLDRLDSRRLSTIPIQDRQGCFQASPFQRWCQLRARALYALGRSADCFALCSDALTRDLQWAADGEGWMRCRLALCKGKLGDIDDAICDLYRLVQQPDIRWYVPYSLSIYLLECDLPHRAFVYMAQAALDPHPESPLSVKWRAFWHGARVCDQLGAEQLSALHALLTVKILIEARRPIADDLIDRVDTLPFDPFAPPYSHELFQWLRPVWETMAAEKRQPIPDTT